MGFEPPVAGRNRGLRLDENHQRLGHHAIMRRILRKIAANEHDALGDTSTLADPSVVDDLVDHRMNR